MKLADVSVHKLSKVFLARGRQWLASAKPFRRKTEVLPPDEELTVNPCYTATLAMYAKGKGDNGSVTIMDIGQQLVCNAYGVNNTSGESRVDIEYNGEPSVATVSYGDNVMSVTITITTKGVLVFSRIVDIVDDIPPTLVVNTTYWSVIIVMLATSRGVAFFRLETVQTGVVDDIALNETIYQAWWLDPARVVELGISNSVIRTSEVVGAPVIDVHTNYTDSRYDYWVVDNKIFITYSNGAAWPESGLLLSKDGVVITEGNVVVHSTTREINRVTYDCVNDAVVYNETGFTGGVWGLVADGPYDSQYLYWLVRQLADGSTSETYVGNQRYFYDGVEQGQTSQHDYPVMRGSGDVNLTTHYTLDYAFTGPNIRSISTVAVTIGQTRYTYDVQPAESSVNDPMFYYNFGDSLYAGKVVTADGVEVDALVYVYGYLSVKGYIAGPGNVLITTPTRRLTDRVCGLHGKITLADDGYLEFQLPYRTLRVI